MTGVVFTLMSTTSYAVSLEEALVSGYNTNEEMQISRSSFLTEIEKFPKALAEFMPKVSALTQVTDFNTKRDSSAPVTVDNITNKGTKYSYALVAEQPIFNGFSSMAGLKSAQFAFKAARGDFYSKEQEIMLKNIEAYLDVVVAEEKYKIGQMSVKANKLQFDAMQEKFKQGEATATDVASAKENYKTSEANLASAKATLDFRKAAFKQVIGLEPEKLKMPAVPSGLITNIDNLFEIVMRSNPSLDSTRNGVQSAKADASSVKGRLLPSVSFKIQADKTKYNVQKTANGNVDSRGVTSILSMNVPILAQGGAEYSDIRRANQNYKRNVLALDATVKSLKAQCVSAISNFISAKNRLSATKQAVKSSEIAYEGMVQEEMLGSKTIIDVSVAEERLSRARENLADTQKALVLNAYRLKALTGEVTAKAMKLPVKYFEPETAFKKVKLKIIGT